MKEEGFVKTRGELESNGMKSDVKIIILRDYHDIFLRLRRDRIPHPA